MPEYLSPGVYIEEVETGAMPIAGVGTSTAGFLGPAQRGPIDPELVTSFAEFQRTFGGAVAVDFDNGVTGVESSYLSYAVEGFFRNGGTRCYVARTTAQDAEAATATLSDTLTVTARGPGTWGNNVRVTVGPAPVGEDKFNVVVEYWTAGVPDGGTEEEPDPDAEEEPTPDEGAVEEPDPDAEEVYASLSLNEGSPEYYAKTINGASNLVEVTEGTTARPPDGTTVLANGNDGGAVGKDDYDGRSTSVTTPSGDERLQRTGLEGFKAVDEIAIVCAPDEATVNGVTGSLVEHCQDMEDRFAVLQSAQGLSPDDLNTAGLSTGTISDGGYAAFYYPWITVLDPVTNVETLVPPGGHVVGVYARTDEERGVHKAPANEQLRGVQELEVDIRTEDQDGLNPKGINCIRSFRGRGIRVWGARTTSPNPLWRYVNVRRLFLYLEESIDEGTQWVVFEPNDESLWARVRQSVGDFLRGAWRDGALVGTTPEEAFYVKCDRSTMTQADIDNGRLIVEVGVAPVKPAEFVVFRITQRTGGAEGS